MPYVPPSYEDLLRATEALEQTFNQFSVRYHPPAYEILCARTGEMEEIYCRYVSGKPKSTFAFTLFASTFVPAPVRLEEISCIARLKDSLPVTTPVSPERNQVHDILLGAFFYRKLSINASYTGSVSGKVLASVGLTSVDSSALYQTIDEILEIKTENTLDALSIATCCRAYRFHMRKLKAEKGSAYIPRDEADFFGKISDIIVKAEKWSIAIAEQMKPLKAIESLADILCKTDIELCAGIRAFSGALSIKLNTVEPLSREAMIACLPVRELSERVKSMLAYLVHDGMSLTKESLRTFVTTMEARLVVKSQYVLLGVYIVALNDAHGAHPELQKSLNTALDALKPGNAMDNEARTLGLAALSSYLAQPDMGRDYDFGAWGCYELLRSKVAQQTMDLQRLMERYELVSV